MHVNHIESAECAEFLPYIQVLPSRTPSPIFAFALAPRLHQVKLSRRLQHLRFDREIYLVCRRFRKFRNQWNPKSWQYGKGFAYHRNPRETLVFDSQCHLVEVFKNSEPRVFGWFELGDHDAANGP